jgi:membrane-associated phospholipid phosphatase
MPEPLLGARTLGTVVLLVGSFSSVPASAQPHPRSLQWDPAVDVTVSGSLGTLWVVSELLKEEVAPAHCRWCDVDAFDLGSRNALVWSTPSTADVISNVTAFVLVPVAAFGVDEIAAAHDGASGNFLEDAVIVAEAGVVAANVTQLVKMLAGRERPFVHMLNGAEKTATPPPADNNLSFFSGHAAETFALATAAGTVSTMRGYRLSPVVWASGLSLAAATCYLRIAADRHWTTDVLVGAVIGAGIGVALPFFFHPLLDDTTQTGAPPVRDRAFRWAMAWSW